MFVIGANIGECAPITTDYIWRCRDHGGKLIVADPRMTPISRNADLYLAAAAGNGSRAAECACCTWCLRDGLEDRRVHRRTHDRLRSRRRIRQAVRSAHGRRA